MGQVHSFSPNKKNPKHRDVIVDVIESNIDTGKVKILKGDMMTVNGTTALEKVLGAVEEGDIIKVTYKGKKPNTTGPWVGQLSNVLDVQVAPAQDKQKFETQAEDQDLV